MSTATATKTKKAKQGSNNKPLSFKQLLGRATKHEHFARLLKTAATTGWLSDETFMTRLTDTELATVKDVVKKDSHARRAEPLDVSGVTNTLPGSVTLPDTVGPMVDSEKVSGKTAKLTVGDKIVSVDGRLFLTMKKRHPHALLYLSHAGEKVIFSEKATVAVLPTQE